MEIQEVAKKLDRRGYTVLQRSIELGHFPNGKKLQGQDRALALQLMLLWESYYLPEEQRSGYIAKTCAKKNAPIKAK